MEELTFEWQECHCKDHRRTKRNPTIKLKYNLNSKGGSTENFMGMNDYAYIRKNTTN